MEERSAVVLLHGFMQSGDDMASVARALLPQFKVLAPTLSAKTAQQATLDALARSVRAALDDELGRDGKAAMLGYSMGGRVALAYARLFPETLSALVLESAGLGPADDAQRQQFAQNNERLAARMEGCADIGEFVDYWETLPLFAGQREANPEAFAAQRERRLQHDLGELSLLTRYAGAHTMPIADDTRSLLQQLDCPVLYIAGRRDAKYSAYAASLEGGNVQVALFDCGHNVHLERPTEFRDCVSRFLSNE